MMSLNANGDIDAQNDKIDYSEINTIKDLQLQKIKLRSLKSKEKMLENVKEVVKDCVLFQSLRKQYSNEIKLLINLINEQYFEMEQFLISGNDDISAEKNINKVLIKMKSNLNNMDDSLSKLDSIEQCLKEKRKELTKNNQKTDDNDNNVDDDDAGNDVIENENADDNNKENDDDNNKKSFHFNNKKEMRVVLKSLVKDHKEELSELEGKELVEIPENCLKKQLTELYAFISALETYPKQFIERELHRNDNADDIENDKFLNELFRSYYDGVLSSLAEEECKLSEIDPLSRTTVSECAQTSEKIKALEKFKDRLMSFVVKFDEVKSFIKQNPQFDYLKGLSDDREYLTSVKELLEGNKRSYLPKGTELMSEMHNHLTTDMDDVLTKLKALSPSPQMLSGYKNNFLNKTLPGINKVLKAFLGKIDDHAKDTEKILNLCDKYEIARRENDRHAEIYKMRKSLLFVKANSNSSFLQAAEIGLENDKVKDKEKKLLNDFTNNHENYFKTNYDNAHLEVMKSYHDKDKKFKRIGDTIVTKNLNEFVKNYFEWNTRCSDAFLKELIEQSREKGDVLKNALNEVTVNGQREELIKSQKMIEELREKMPCYHSTTLPLTSPILPAIWLSEQIKEINKKMQEVKEEINAIEEMVNELKLEKNRKETRKFEIISEKVAIQLEEEERKEKKENNK